MDPETSIDDVPHGVEGPAGSGNASRDIRVVRPAVGRGRLGVDSAALARVVTEVLSPVPLVTAMQLLLGWIGGHHQAIGLLFGTVAVLITIVPPYVFLLCGVRQGRFTDRHLGDRRQRFVPLLFGMVAAVIGVVVLALADAPRLLLAGTETAVIGLLVATVINLFWKMSGHTATAAAVLVVCVEVGHAWLWLAAPLLVVIGWARVKLEDHSVAQVIVGAVVGALIAGVAMLTLA